jgi:hypothetical protein
MSITNYQGLRITVRPTQEPSTYEFIVENHGDSTLWHIAFPTYELLGPLHFGLDDTHMPESLTKEAPAVIHCLEPRASVAFTRRKWGPLARYQGPASGSLYATFSPREDGEGRLGLRAAFTVVGATPRQRNSPYTSSHPRAFHLGRILGNLIGKRRGS